MALIRVQRALQVLPQVIVVKTPHRSHRLQAHRTHRLQVHRCVHLALFRVLRALQVLPQVRVVRAADRAHRLSHHRAHRLSRLSHHRALHQEEEAAAAVRCKLLVPRASSIVRQG